jgi:two-component system, NarL family, sensor histidine kinase DegS
MMVVSEPQDENSDWEILKNEIKEEYEQAQRELKEIELMMEHSQLEVSKLTQRNASITAHLQQVQGQFDSLPRGDIRQAYDNALDSQQRLFVMRGQLEKLQSDHAHLERYTTTLGHVLELLDNSAPEQKRVGASRATVETVEMMIQAQEAERQRLSRQMHDGPAQALSNFILQTEIAMRLFDIDQAKAREELESLKVSATSTFQKVRDFIFELRPMMLDDLGLAPTLKRYIDAVKDQSGVDIQLMVTGMDRRLENYLEVMVFRSVQELLASSIRESHATKVTVDLDIGEKNVKVTVEDNGKGFDAETLSDRNNMGIKVIKERVEMLGGFMDISSSINQGTHITFQIPAMMTGGFA